MPSLHLYSVSPEDVSAMFILFLYQTTVNLTVSISYCQFFPGGLFLRQVGVLHLRPGRWFPPPPSLALVMSSEQRHSLSSGQRSQMLVPGASLPKGHTCWIGEFWCGGRGDVEKKKSARGGNSDEMRGGSCTPLPEGWTNTVWFHDLAGDLKRPNRLGFFLVIKACIDIAVLNYLTLSSHIPAR